MTTNVIDPRAVLPSPPPTLPPWAKVLWYIAETVAVGVTFLQYDYGQEIAPTGGGTTEPDPNTWRKFQIIAGNEISVERADDQAFTIDLVNYTNGSVDNTWTSTDYTNVGTQLQALVTAYCPFMASYLKFTEARAYVMAFNPYEITDKPFAQSGSPEAIIPLTGAGIDVGCPPQVACSVTELTASRPHWGRFYLPTVGVDNFVNGRLTATAVNAIASAVDSCYANLSSMGFYPVVATTQVTVDKVVYPTRVLQSVSQVRVDDVSDVIRRRRYRSPLTTVSKP